MNLSLPTHSMAVVALAVSAFGTQAPAAVAGNHFTPPGMELCLNPPCPPPNPGGLVNPPAPPAPPGGGGLGPFGKGVVGGIGMGVGLGLVQGLTRPQQPQVIVQQPQPTYVQPAPVQVAPPPQPVSGGPVSGGLSPHDQFCLGKYKSYNIQTKQYLSYSGQYRFCQSPYM